MSTEEIQQISATSIGDDSDNDAEENAVIVISKRNGSGSKMKLYGSILFGVLLIIACGITIGVLLNNGLLGGDKKLDGETASYQMEDLMKQNESYNNFTESEQLEYEESFNYFDEDNDGYLNETEFVQYFELELTHAKVFERIDADKDGILSYGEVVTYVNEMNEINAVHEQLMGGIAQQISMIYGYNLSSYDENAQLFLEYVSMFMYFEPFDLDNNGYIAHDEYLLISSQMEFRVIDSNHDGLISLDELGETQYGDDEVENSWEHKLRVMYGDEYEAVIHELDSIEITQEMVDEMNDNLQLCPNQISSSKSSELEVADPDRRRMATAYYCNCYYDYVCYLYYYNGSYYYYCYYEYYCYICYY